MSRLVSAALVGTALLAGCGTSAPASIQAPAQITVSDTTLQTLQAQALDASGNVLEGVAVELTGVSDPGILKAGKGGALQCTSFGTATATLSAPPAKLDVIVRCMLIKEITPSPAELVLTMVPGPDGALVPSKSAKVGFTVVGLDGKPVTGADVAITVADPSVVALAPDGTATAKTRGQTTIKAVVADKIGTVDVVVGEQVLARQGQPLPDSETLGIPMEAGTYRITLGASQPVAISANGGSCLEHEAGTALDVTCNLRKTGTLVVTNPGTLGMGEDATVTMRIIRMP